MLCFSDKLWLVLGHFNRLDKKLAIKGPIIGHINKKLKRACIFHSTLASILTILILSVKNWEVVGFCLTFS